jgi:hypothetical protein
MEDDKYSFCTKCGQELPEGSVFCPSCGANIGEPQVSKPVRTSNVNLDTVAILIYIYAAFAILIGLFCVYIALQADMILNMMKDMAPEEYQQLINAGIDAAALAAIYSVPAILMILSGIFALLSGMSVSKRTNNQRAFILCILASVLAFPLIITLIVGVVVALKIKEGEDQFIS